MLGKTDLDLSENYTKVINYLQENKLGFEFEVYRKCLELIEEIDVGCD